MGHRALAVSLMVVGIVFLASLPADAQAPRTVGDTWTAPRTSWGDPDLQGTWTNTTTTPLQRPSSLVGQEFLTDEERAALDEENAPGIDAAPGVGAYNNFWMEQGFVSQRTSLIVDPPEGRLPAITPKAQHRLDIPERVPAGTVLPDLV